MTVRIAHSRRGVDAEQRFQSSGSSASVSSGLAAPWLGLNGNHANSSVFGGSQTFFSTLGISFTRCQIQQGQVNDDNGVPLLTDMATCSSIGQTPVVVVSPSTYGGGAFPTGGAIATFATYFVSQVQAVESAYPKLGALYEIDNEPWNFYSPGATAAQYADLVVQVINACITAKLDVTRVFPMIKDMAWIGGMYSQQATLKTIVQGWSFHPYGPPPPQYGTNTIQGISAIPNARGTLFSGANNIIISEVGFQDRQISNTAGGGVSDANNGQVAEWMQLLLEQALEYRLAGWLRAMLIFHRTSGNFAMVVVNSSGVLTPAGTALVQFGGRSKSGIPGRAFAPRSPGLWLPYDDNAVAATMDPVAAGSTVTPGAGRILSYRVRVDSYEFVSKVVVAIPTAGVGLTAGQCFIALYQQQANNVWAQQLISADQSGNWNSTGLKTISFTGGQSLVPGYYIIAILQNFATSGAGFYGSAVSTAINFGGFGTMPQRAMQGAATGITSLPGTMDLHVNQNSAANMIFAALCP
jgi:hypothetical protein